MKPYYEQLGLSGDNEYVIINNGCSTHQTKDWKLVAWKELNVENILYLDKISKQTPAQLTLFDEERYLVVDEKPSELVTYDASLVFTTPTEISLEEAISGKNIIFQAMFLAQPDELDTFEKQFGSQISQRFSGVRSQPVIYEAMPKGTTKATALKQLAQHLEIKPQEIMAFGDANNDIEMIQFAGLGVAMGNSSDYIKKLANYVTDTNDENGVATAIEKFIFNN